MPCLSGIPSQAMQEARQGPFDGWRSSGRVFFSLRLLEASNGEFVLISHGHGKFGRVIGELYANKQSVNKILLKEGLVKEYEG